MQVEVLVTRGSWVLDCAELMIQYAHCNKTKIDQLHLIELAREHFALKYKAVL